MDDVTTSGRTSRESVTVAEAFVSLADTLVDDFDVVELLDRLARRCVDMLGVGAAAIMLVTPDRTMEVVASSDETSRLMKVFQIESQSGPCIDAVRTGEAVVVDDPAELRRRWPPFSRAVEGAGFSSIYVLPLRLRSESIGALSLFNADQPPLSGFDQRFAQALADVATIGVLQHRQLARRSQLADQLQSALTTRVGVEQAKGVLAEHAGVDMDDAFEALRTYARSRRVKLSDVAHAVVRRAIDPSDIIAARHIS